MNIVLADSNNLIRIGLRSILNTNKDISVVAEANSSEDLLDILTSFTIDLVIIDYTSMNFSIDVVVKLKKLYSNIKILAITYEKSPQVIVDAFKSGVTSYVKKDCSISEIMDAVSETLKGEKFYCGSILEIIKDVDIDNLDSDILSCESISLSKRECEIISLIAEGYTNAQIAKYIFLSPHTVSTHRKNIMSKLGVKNTAGIVMYAVKTDLISPNKFLFKK
ncbi:MAG: hypothetical protein CL844_02430 [Crocinitomicaceae bacterium]|nr:hypothetical protein [Crocinitomicaceae bacterium]|tara:strand:+ start:93661 stop:94323 length:663 start_codon:yes stop_codon:yes gene_type:complete